jgi:predicted Ser/Thr protein kinase
MLDMALATFNKLPFTQDMKLVYVNLGLDYENRGQRDKAFLVYKKVFDSDPGFGDVALRMERLVQGAAGTSAFMAPTMHVAGAPTPMAPTVRPAAESPLAALVTEPGSHGEAPTAMRPTLGPGRAEPTPAAGLTPRPLMTPSPTRQMPPTVVGTPFPVATAGAPTPAPGGPVVPGTRFGRYEVERHLGRGGMGDVYLVRDTVINRKAALKTIRVDADLDPSQVIEMRQRFYREGQTAGQLTHPNIVTVYDLGEDLGMSYIVMEFVEGQTLTQLMKKERLTLPQIQHVIYNAAIGLDHAHQAGIFHRDVKPDNIIVSKTGMVKVMDFGIARIVESTLTKTGSLIGTPAYMSPEQVHGQKIDARSDIFSLGVILYELLTGKKPFTGETISSLMFAIIEANPVQASTVDGKIDPVWDEILRKALSKTREERYSTAREFALAVKDAPAR